MATDEPTADGDGASIVDWDTARQNIPGGRQGVVELAGIMQEECGRLMEEIRLGFERGSASRIKLAAHTLRGAALHFGARSVVEATTEMQAFAAADSLEDARDAWPRLEALVAGLVAELCDADRHVAASESKDSAGDVR